MTRFGLVVLSLSVCTAACIDHTRINNNCIWNPERVRDLDFSQWPQQRHLYDDVAIAEEIAIRHADAVHKERFGSFGHGGLIENGALRDRCMATLMNAIAATHDLPLDRVEQARARGYRDPRWDLAVLLSFVCLYGIAAWTVARAISRRFPTEDGGWFARVVPLLASIPIGIAGVQLFALWGAVSESIRVGNGHVSSYRSAKSPWADHQPAIVLAAVALYAVVAARRYSIERRRSRRLTAS